MTAKRRADLAAMAARVGGQTDPPPVGRATVDEVAVEPQPQAAAAPRPRSAPRVKPVRVVVELQPVEHRGLKRLADQFAEQLDLTSVAMAEVIRVLLDLVQEDAQLAERVAAELGKTGGDRRR